MVSCSRPGLRRASWRMGSRACTFTYAPGTAERAGLVTLQFTVSAQGESISLLSQVHVDNVP